MKIFDGLHGFFWTDMHTNNCNTYLIEGKSPILIDPGHADLFDHVEQGLRDNGLSIGDIGLVICTHAHPDHIEGIRFFKETQALVAIHEKEWRLIRSMAHHVKAMFGMDPAELEPDILLKDGKLSVHGLDFEVYHTPGHSPGSISLYWPKKKALFSGDLIFKEGVGRTDLPGGDGEVLKNSILMLSKLKLEWLLPGHGEIVEGKKNIEDNFNHMESFWFKYI